MALLSWFQKRKALNSSEYEQLSEKLRKLSVFTQDIEAQIVFLDAQYQSLKGKYIKLKTPGYAKEEEDEKSKYSDGLDDLREATRKSSV